MTQLSPKALLLSPSPWAPGCDQETSEEVQPQAFSPHIIFKVFVTKDLAESENLSVHSPHRRHAVQRSVSVQSCTDPQKCSRSTQHGSKTQGRHPWSVARRPLFWRS